MSTGLCSQCSDICFFKKEKVKIRKTEEVVSLVCCVYNPGCDWRDNKLHRKLTGKQAGK